MKIKSKLTSMLLVVTTVLTSIGLQPFTAYAQTKPNVWNGGVAASSSADCRKLDIDDVGPALVPDVQMVRVTLMKTTETGDASGGYPVTANELPNLIQNPIHMVPENYTAIWGSDIENHIRSPKNIDPNRLVKQGSVFNSRREYLGNKLTGNNTESGPSSPESYVLSYGCHLQGYNNDESGKPQNYQWVFTDSKFTTQQIDKVFPDKCVGNVVSSISGGKANAYYQDNPPVPEINSDMSASDYFDAIAKAVFEENDPSTGINSDGAKQVFIYHIVADMLGYDDDPYCTEVESVVQDVMNRKYEILIEPMLTWDVSKSKVLQTMFGEDVPYISMTAGDLTTEDAISTVFFGATSAQALANDANASVERNFNPITHGKQSSGYMSEFYKSLQLKDTDARVNLHSVSDKNYFNNLFNAAINSAEKYGDNPAWSTSSTGHNYGGKFEYGPLYEGQSGAYVKNPFCGSVSYNLAQRGVDPNNVECEVDMASMFNTGALYIIQPQYSKIDFKVNELVGEGGQTGQLTLSDGRKLPIFKNAFVGSTNTVYFKASSKINIMNDENIQVTKWLDDVLLQPDENIHLPIRKNNGDDNIDINELQPPSSTQPNFIPGLTLTTLTATYVNEKGEPIEYNQVDGTSASAGTSILAQVDDPTKKNSSKLFLCNLDFYSYDQTEAQPQVLSVKKATFIANIGCF